MGALEGVGGEGLCLLLDQIRQTKRMTPVLCDCSMNPILINPSSPSPQRQSSPLFSAIVVRSASNAMGNSMATHGSIDGSCYKIRSF